jgi:hypothetical protein
MTDSGSFRKTLSDVDDDGVVDVDVHVDLPNVERGAKHSDESRRNRRPQVTRRIIRFVVV